MADEPTIVVEASVPVEVAEATAEAQAATAETAVAVEQAAGETAVAVAEVHAETEQARIAANAETDQAAIAAAAEVARSQVSEAEQIKAELAECRSNIATIQTSQAETLAALSSIQAQLTPPPPPNQPASESRVQMPDNHEAPAPEPVKKKPAFRLI